jgi:hypothetical protein
MLTNIFLEETLLYSLPRDDSGLRREGSLPPYAAGNIVIILRYDRIEVE